jgi:hypothetical protein
MVTPTTADLMVTLPFVSTSPEKWAFDLFQDISGQPQQPGVDPESGASLAPAVDVEADPAVLLEQPDRAPLGREILPVAHCQHGEVSGGDQNLREVELPCLTDK